MVPPDQRCIHTTSLRDEQKPSVILRYDTVVSIVRRKAASEPAPSSSFKWSEVMRWSAPTEFLRTDPALYPLLASQRSEGIITSRWAITSLLILAVTSELSPKAGWPNGTLEHPRHPPVSPTQQTVIDFCKLSYYHDDSLLFCWPIYLSSSCNYRARLWF